MGQPNPTNVTPTYDPPPAEKEALDLVKRAVEECRRWHQTFAFKVEKRYSAWRGMAPDNTPRNWRSQLHPPHLINIVEGMLASMEEGEPAWQVDPRILPGMDIQEASEQGDKAKLNEYLVTDLMRCDGFPMKQSTLFQQDLIAGFTVGKVSWLKDQRLTKYNDRSPEMISDDGGGTIDIAMKVSGYSETKVLYDGPTLTPRDVRDFLYPESAVSLEAAPFVIDRAYVTYETLEKMQALGIYQNVDYVKETRWEDSNRDMTVVANREMDLRSADRTRGLVELIEYWEDDRCITVANKSVVLRDKSGIYWHGKKPFVIHSAIPDIFQIPGISVIEGLAQLQDMLWTLTNTRLDATRMMANVITLIRGDLDNADDFEWEPNAQWIVPDPNAVKTLDINPAVATITLQAEGLIRGDIQNIMGGLPYTGGAQSQTQDQSTATGISIVTNIAQAVLARRKGMHMRACGKYGGMFLDLAHQFFTEPRTVEIMGPGAARRYQEVDPVANRGHYSVSVKMTGDSMLRQERRAESQTLLTLALQAAPVQASMGEPLEMKAFWEKTLEAYGESNVDKFFKAAATPGAGAAAVPPGPGGGANGAGTPPDTASLMDEMAGGGAGGGVTNVQKSTDASGQMSAATALQQTGARTGAGRSV